MASACVNNMPDSFLDCPPTKYPSYGWLSPRISFSREFPDEESSSSSKAAAAATVGGGAAKAAPMASEKAVTDRENREESDPGASSKDFVDFEFRLEDPVTMLPADELFSDGKLVPMQLSMIRPAMTSSETTTSEVRSPDTPKLRRRLEISTTDPYLFSPKAPRCSSRWKELLGLKKLYQNSNKQEHQKTTSASGTTTSNSAHKSLKHFLHRSSKSSLSSSLDSSLSLPLLKDADNESVSISSSRLSLSSSSSGHEHDDLPRLSLDSEKPNVSRIANQNNTANGISNPPRLRVVKARALSSENPTAAVRVGRSPMRRAPESTIRGVSVDSPRMNSSGKIVFHSLERSSSSPSSFNGGPRHKHRGMERSYSANVRVTPVLNVPVCSLRGSSKSGSVFGFPLFSSSSGNGGGGSKGGGTQNSSKNRADRTLRDFGNTT